VSTKAPRKTARPWLPRRLRMTREGWWFLSATLLLGLGAINAGLNLLFAIFGMMLFLILASGVMSELCLRELRLTRRPPRIIHADTPFLMGIVVRNEKSRLPTFSLEVEDLTDERPVERRCYFLKLPAGRQQETAYRNTLHRRGLHDFIGFRISTRFPFGLIRKSRDIEVPTQVLVYPALVPVDALHLEGGMTQQNTSNTTRQSRAGQWSGMRDYRPGDDPRQIHWRSSAKRRRLLVRESEEESGKRAVVILDEPPIVRPPEPDGSDPAFEAAVSLAASVALALLNQGFEVDLQTRSVSVRGGSGPGAAQDILRALALLSPGGADVERPALPGRATRYRIAVGSLSPVVEITPPGQNRESAA